MRPFPVLSRLTGLLGVLGLLAPGAAVADEAALAERLAAHGYENVAVREEGGDLVVRYENRIHRYELHALGEVAFLALPEAGDGTLTLVPHNRRTPVLTVTAPASAWRDLLADASGEASFVDAVRIRDGGPGGPAGSRSNSSLARVDLPVRPLFAFELGVADDPFVSSFYLAPEAVSTLLPGTLATLQAQVRVWDDLDDFSRAVKPGRNTLSWAGWIPGNVLVAASGGIFGGNRYGFAGEASRLVADGHLELKAGGDYSGFLKFSRNVTLYSDLDAWSAFLAGTVRFRGIDLELTGTGARFIEGDWGGRLDVDRRFGEVRIGLFGIATESDEVFGFHFEVPLPVRHYSRPKRVRLSTVPTFPFEYRDSSFDVGRQVSLFDDTARMRKILYPTFVLNNLADVRAGAREAER
jgi:hypothetical protein